jgi:hypothetical protein
LLQYLEDIPLKSFLASLLLVIPTLAVAEEAPTCFTRESIVEAMMAERASPVFVAPMGRKMFEIWSNGTKWSAFHTTPDGKMCLIGGGQQGYVADTPRCIDPVRCPPV